MALCGDFTEGVREYYIPGLILCEMDEEPMKAT